MDFHGLAIGFGFSVFGLRFRFLGGGLLCAFWSCPRVFCVWGPIPGTFFCVFSGFRVFGLRVKGLGFLFSKNQTEKSSKA